MACECFRCWVPIQRFDAEAEFLLHLATLIESEWTMEKRWRVMRLIQPTDVATVLFSLNEMISMMMGAIFIVMDRRGELRHTSKAIIGNIVGKLEIYWPNYMEFEPRSHV